MAYSTVQAGCSLPEGLSRRLASAGQSHLLLSVETIDPISKTAYIEQLEVWEVRFLSADQEKLTR